MSGVLHAVQHKIWTHYVHFGTGLEVCDCVEVWWSVVWMCFQTHLLLYPCFPNNRIGPVHQGSRCGASVPWSQALPETNDMATEVANFGGERWIEDVEVSTPRWWQLKHFWNFHPENLGNDPIRLDNIFQLGVKPTN